MLVETDGFPPNPFASGPATPENSVYSFLGNRGKKYHPARTMEGVTGYLLTDDLGRKRQTYFFQLGHQPRPYRAGAHVAATRPYRVEILPVIYAYL